MNTPLLIQAGALRCEIQPALGGCVAGLWRGEQQVLRSTPADQLQTVRLSGSYPLVPYSNRIGYGQLHWAGQQWTLDKNFAPEPHAIHGVGWERAWDVVSASATRCELVYSHQPDAAWPFAFDASQTFTLSDSALEMQMAITNRADTPAPVGLGWHPYFAKSAQTALAFTARGRWEMGADKLPTQRLAHSGLHCDCTELDVDHCFDGWSGTLELTEAGLRVRVTSDLNHLVVFTTPGRDSIAIEPVSHVNNALALAAQAGDSAEQLGIRVLQPGERLEAAMRISVEAAT